MRTIKLMSLTFIVAVFTLMSCEKDQDVTVLDMSKAESAALTEPAEGVSYILSEENAEDTLITFGWSPANYPVDNMGDVQYHLEFDAAGNDFASAIRYVSTFENSFKMVSGELNTALEPLSLDTALSHPVEFRILSQFPGVKSSVVNSEPLTISIKPFFVVVPPIYLLGDATTAGWSNTAALEMTHVEDKIFTITTTLDGDMIKFIKTLGAWAPQWGTDDTGTWESGPLVYRLTDDEPDPVAIPAPPTAGEYVITADIDNLTYTVEPAK
jgi:starch-binding outer membrane protein SusE/F